MYSPNGHRVPLGVAVGRPGRRGPDDALVEDLARLRGRRRSRPTSTGTPTAADRLADVAVERGVEERVERRGVLRPDHEVRRRHLARRGVGGQPDRGVHVVAGHLAVVVEDVGRPARARCPAPRRPSARRRWCAAYGASAGSSVTSAEAERGHATGRPGRVRTCSTAQASVVPTRATGGSRRRSPTYGRAGAERGVGGGEGEPAPRHAAERPAGPPDLDGDPQRGRPHRPAPAPGARPRTRRPAARRRPSRAWRAPARRPSRPTASRTGGRT